MKQLITTTALISITLTPLAATAQGAAVTMEEIKREYARSVPADRLHELATDEKLLQQLVEQALLTKRLAAKAQANGLDKSAKTQADLEWAKARTLADAQREADNNTIKAPNFDERAREVYLTNKPKFSDPATYSFWHILLSTRCKTQDEQKRLANELLAQMDKGANIEDIAVKHSDELDVSQHKGLLTEARADKLMPNIVTALETLDGSKKTAIVHTNLGYHLVKLQSKLPGAVQPYEAVKSKIIEELQRDYQSKERVKLANAYTKNDPQLSEAKIKEVADFLSKQFPKK
jgi:peptidyl-prolyl cis-trans isomerase C